MNSKKIIMAEYHGRMAGYHSRQRDDLLHSWDPFRMFLYPLHTLAAAYHDYRSKRLYRALGRENRRAA